MSKSKIRVAVVYGGKSGEHEISLLSAASVVKFLDKQRFEVVPIGIDKQGQWYVNKLSDVFSENKAWLDVKVASSKPMPMLPGLDVDVMFPVLHGPMGEDGTVQGLFELANLPYVGAGVLASAVIMDKEVSKRLLEHAGLPVVNYCVVDTVLAQDKQRLLQTVSENLTYPVFVKPARMGSSVGIHKVKKPEELSAAISDALLYDEKLLVEKALNARDIELSVLENLEFGGPPLVSEPGEILYSRELHEFYSYQAKYTETDSLKLQAPAELSKHQIEQAQQMARRVFTVLQCEGMARVDLFLDRNSDQFFVNEANTIPGFTDVSMYPKMWQASGVEYSELLTKLVELALARYQRKQGLLSDYHGKLSVT